MAGEEGAPSQAHPAVALESTLHLAVFLLLPEPTGSRPARPQLFPLAGPGLPWNCKLLGPLSPGERHRLPERPHWKDCPTSRAPQMGKLRHRWAKGTDVGHSLWRGVRGAWVVCTAPPPHTPSTANPLS